MASRKDYELALKIIGKVDPSLATARNLTKRELAAIARDVSEANGRLAVQTANDFKTLDAGFSKVEKAVGAAVKVAAGASAAIGAYSFKVGSDFSAQMSTVKAIANASADDIGKLSDKAKDLGISTKWSATEVGQAYEYMGMAGWKTADMLSGVEGVMSLAAASGEELGTVSDIVTDDLTAFGLKASDAGRMADVMAAAATNANTNVGLMGETFKYAAPLAGTLGYSLEDVTLATGLMANAGIKGSQAGTALRNVMTRLVKPTKESASAMAALGLSATDDEGRMKPLRQMLEEMRGALDGVTESEQGMYAAQLAGQYGLSGLLAIVNSSDEDFEKLANAIDHSTGAADRMAKARIDNLAGDITLAQSAAEGLGISLEELADDALREVVQMASEAMQDLAGYITKNAPTIKRELGEVAGSIKEAASPLLSAGQFFLKNPKALSGAIVSLGSAMATYKVASTSYQLFKSLSAIAGLGPVGIGVLGATATVGAIVAATQAYDAWSDSVARSNLAEHFGDLTLSMKELQTAARFIVDTGDFEQLSTTIEALGTSEEIAARIKAAGDELKKLDWKLSIGMELSDSDTESYKASIEQYIRECEAYAEEQHYAISLAVDLFTGDDAHGEAISSMVDRYLTKNGDKLRTLSQELSDKLSEFLAEDSEGGITLSLNESKTLQRIREQMAEITAQMAQEDYTAGLDILGGKYGKNLTADSFENLMLEEQKLIESSTADYEEAWKAAVLATRASGGTDEDVKYINNQWMAKIAAMQTQAASFNTKLIKDSYAGELDTGAYSAGLDSILAQFGTGGKANIDYMLAQTLQQGSVSGETQKALGELFKQMKPNEADMMELAQDYLKAGEALPENLYEGIRSAAEIGAEAGDIDSMYFLLGNQMAGNPEYLAALAAAMAQGTVIPEKLRLGIEANGGVIPTAVTATYDSIKDADKSGMEAEAKATGEAYDTKVAEAMEASSDTIKSGAQTAVDAASGVDVSKASSIGESWGDRFVAGFKAAFAGIGGFIAGALSGPAAPSKVAHNAEGGIYERPLLTTFAEDGPEAAIPLDGSHRALTLWREAGRRLGALSDAGQQFAAAAAPSSTPSAAASAIPSIHLEQHFSGPVTEENAAYAAKITTEELKRMLEQISRQDRRFAFQS